MPKLCVAEAAGLGVNVKVWSGRQGRPQCNLSSYTDVQHLVFVENLRLYPSTVRCKGSIVSDPKHIKFVPAGPDSVGDDETWLASINGLPGKLGYMFSPCFLHAIGHSQGTDTIKTEVSIEWYRPGKNETVKLDIRVSV
jgi:hypothetical protein